MDITHKLTTETATAENIGEIFAHVIRTGPALVTGITMAAWSANVAPFVRNVGAAAENRHMSETYGKRKGVQRTVLVSSTVAGGIFVDFLRRPAIDAQGVTTVATMLADAWAESQREWPEDYATPIAIDADLLASMGKAQKPDTGRIVNEPRRKVAEVWTETIGATYFKR